MTGTLRRPSRWWFPAVPVAIAAMLASSGYRVNDLWYQQGQHRAVAEAGLGEWAGATASYRDAHGETTRTFEVRFAGWGETSGEVEQRLTPGETLQLPTGMVAKQVRLDFRAEPDQVLRYCILSLIDDTGRSYRLGDLVGPLTGDPCVPEATPGPQQPIVKEQPRGELPFGSEPRPREWTVTPALVVPEDATFVELRVSFENPDYVTLTLPR